MKTAPIIHSLAKPIQISEARINISNLRLRTFIGFNPEEKTKQQDVIVNAEIHYRADPVFISDNQSDALNYKNIVKRMIHHIENGRFHLLEKLTADLVAIASESEQVSYAEVRVDKPHALRFADSVSVTLSASRHESHS
ncbi:MAG: D-erythro-7,8-dihydroneopterin triphosphate epimerase [Gammaproteobacteria bacterium]|jgi:D-erythro-7,8-dihydroneopterin triphosphate epimerase